MKKWLLNIEHKPKKENFFIAIFNKIFGIKQMSCVNIIEGIEAETVEDAIKSIPINIKELEIEVEKGITKTFKFSPENIIITGREIV